MWTFTLNSRNSFPFARICESLEKIVLSCMNWIYKCVDLLLTLQCSTIEAAVLNWIKDEKRKECYPDLIVMDIIKCPFQKDDDENTQLDGFWVWTTMLIFIVFSHWIFTYATAAAAAETATQSNLYIFVLLSISQERNCERTARISHVPFAMETQLMRNFIVILNWEDKSF